MNHLNRCGNTHLSPCDAVTVGRTLCMSSGGVEQTSPGHTRNPGNEGKRSRNGLEPNSRNSNY